MRRLCPFFAVLLAPLLLCGGKVDPADRISEVPEDGLVGFVVALMKAEQPADLYEYIDGPMLEAISSVDTASGNEILAKWRRQFKRFEAYLADTSFRGRRSQVIVQGLDTMAYEKARLTAILVQNKAGGWRVSSFSFDIDESQIAEEMREWTLGSDKVKVNAIFEDDDGTDVTLLTSKMKRVDIPRDAFSSQDIAWLDERLSGKLDRFALLRQDFIDDQLKRLQDQDEEASLEDVSPLY